MAARPSTLLGSLQRLLAQAESRAIAGSWSELATSVDRAAALLATWLQPGTLTRGDAPTVQAPLGRLERLNGLLAAGRTATTEELNSTREVLLRLRGTRRSYGYATAPAPALRWSGSA